MNNIRSLWDSQKEEKEHETESFAGGEKSGIAIANPSSSQDASNKWMANIPHMSGPPPKDSTKVTIYKNGFIVNDGEFRPMDTPENEKFMKELKAGYAPQELQRGALAGNVHIVLDDRHSQTFELPPPPKYVLFSGEGQQLSSSSSSSNTTTAVPLVTVDSSHSSVRINPSLPTTTLVIRFANGQRVNQTFNESHTVADLHAYVRQVSGVSKFQLVFGFPPSPIENCEKNSQSLKDAGLLNALIQQRIP